MLAAELKRFKVEVEESEEKEMELSRYEEEEAEGKRKRTEGSSWGKLTPFSTVITTLSALSKRRVGEL
jgi:hypothetical protein